MKIESVWMAMVVTLALLAGAAATQSAPQLINYQGRIADPSGAPLAGSTVDLAFRFYSAATGGTLYLTILQQDVAVSNGSYNVLVGSGAITPGAEISLANVFRNHAEVWLGVAAGADPEMTPRSRIASVPYALACTSSAGIDLSLVDRYVNQPDYDADGHDKPLFSGDDCNDSEAGVYPGAPEVCDGLDNQCPGDPGYGLVDEGCAGCEDLDGDGRGWGCAQGTDCDDLDPNNFLSCAACSDLDGDDSFAGCDDYVTIAGPDCDDLDLNNWTSCETCADLDGDDFYSDCDHYLSIAGPDCDDLAPTTYPGAPETCGDSLDNQCPGDPGYGTVDEGCPGPPAAPINLAAAAASSSQINLRWTDNSDDETGFKLERKTGSGGVYAEVATVAAGSTSYPNTGLDASTVYYYRVRAYNGAENSDYSNEANATTNPPGMALIPSGSFDMGDAFSEGNGNERPVHSVSLTDFYMDAHEVTNAEYAACVSGAGCTAPSNSTSSTRTLPPYYFGNPLYDNFPVIYVTWNQATAYCAWAGKRLPTEAEWEYAARGGLSGKRYPWGDAISCSDANYGGASGCIGDTNTVGSYAANGYGLYDMAGNVSEWVNDWYSANYYSTSPTNNPTGPPSGTARVLRGGGWGSATTAQRVAYRLGLNPTTYKDNGSGFRCARN